jgi:voltage-gated potassium channel
MNENNSNHEHVGLFQLVVLILSVVVLGALFADTAFKLPSQISNVLQTVDTLVCILLLSDFGVRFYWAKSKLAFIKWGWIDLIASIPNIPILRIGRLVRILRVIRLLRAIRATHKITSIILRNKIQSGFASVILTSFLLVTFASIGILICEQPEPTANIKTAEDAVWWSVATITTVGCHVGNGIAPVAVTRAAAHGPRLHRVGLARGQSRHHQTPRLRECLCGFSIAASPVARLAIQRSWKT